MKHGAVTSATIGAAAGELLAANDKRVSVILSPPGAGRVTISDSTGVVLDAGITLTAGSQPLKLSLD